MAVSHILSLAVLAVTTDPKKSGSPRGPVRLDHRLLSFAAAGGAPSDNVGSAATRERVHHSLLRYAA